MGAHAFSGPLAATFGVAAGILVGVGPKGFSRAFRRPGRSMGFTLRFLVGVCLLYGIAWALQAI